MNDLKKGEQKVRASHNDSGTMADTTAPVTAGCTPLQTQPSKRPEDKLQPTGEETRDHLKAHCITFRGGWHLFHQGFHTYQAHT